MSIPSKKKRVTIYIDEEVWKIGKELAWESRISFSRWLEGLIRVLPGTRLIIEIPVKENPDMEYESKVYVGTESGDTHFSSESNSTETSAKDEKPELKPEKKEQPKAKKSVADRIRAKMGGGISESDEKLLRDAQARINRVQGRSVESLTGFSGPRPKKGK